MLDLAKEFGFKVAAFHHGVEAYKLADRLAAEGVCGALWADWWGFKMEAFDGIQENIALVDRPANGCAIVHSDSRRRHPAPQPGSGEGDGARAPRRHGHRAGTRDPLAHAEPRARRWASLDQTGTLEPGKMADVVVWNGNPFSVYAHAEQVYVDGARVFDRNDRSAAAGVGFHARPGCRGAGRCAVRRFIDSVARRHSRLADTFELACCNASACWSCFAMRWQCCARPAAGDVAGAQDLLIRNATVHTAGAQGTLENADVLVRGGRIRAVGTGLAAPAGAHGRRRATAGR